MNELPPELRAEQEWLIEKERNELDFQNCLKVLDLSADDLRSKKILDVGAGIRRFGVGCIVRGLTKDIYSLDDFWGVRESTPDDEQLNPDLKLVRVLPTDIRTELDKRTFTAKAEAIPTRDNIFDLVIAHAVPSAGEEQLSQRVRELLRVGKEVRIFPIIVEPHSVIDIYERILENLRSEFNFEAEYKITLDKDFKRGDKIFHSTQKVLIIRKKEESIK